MKKKQTTELSVVILYASRTQVNRFREQLSQQSFPQIWVIHHTVGKAVQVAYKFVAIKLHDNIK